MINRFIGCIICFSLLINLFILPFSVLGQEQKSVLITELMVNPEGIDKKIDDSKGEWIEVFNNSSVEVNLNEWEINDGQKHEISGNYTIPPNGYAVICRNEESLQNGGVKCDYQAPMVLSNSGEIVILKDSEGNTIDQITYAKEDTKDAKGKSINISSDASRTISIETIFTYGMGDFGTPAKNPFIGTRSFATIQDALNASLAGDTINVPKGEYSENLSVEEEISLIGAGVGQTNIFNNNCNHPVIIIDADKVTVAGFTLDDNECGNTIVQINEGTGIVVEENEITKGQTGIVVYSALGNKANKNLVTGNGVGVKNNDTANIFDARFNFWGDKSGPFHESLNPDGQGDSVSDHIMFRPFYTDSQKTTLSTFSVSKGEFNPITFFSNGVFSLPEGVIDEKDTTSVFVNEQMTINVAMLDGSHSVDLPSGIVITRKGGGRIDATKLSVDEIEIASLSGFTSETVVEGGVQWGIPDVGLEFSEAVSLNIFVGTSKNGQTLNILRSTSTGSDWTSDGIVSPATCTVSQGACSFQATKASYFAAIAIVPTSTPTPTPASSVSSATSSSGSSSGNSSSSNGAKAPTCDDAKPGSSPTLLSALPGANSVTLNWSKALDTVTHYLLGYGRANGVFEFGNSNIGGKDSTSYTVYDLSDRTRYYFRVMAVNNCKPGDFSNELSTATFGTTKSLLAVSTTEALGAASDQRGPKNQSHPDDIRSANLFTSILNLFGAIVSFFGRLFR